MTTLSTNATIYDDDGKIIAENITVIDLGDGRFQIGADCYDNHTDICVKPDCIIHADGWTVALNAVSNLSEIRSEIVEVIAEFAQATIATVSKSPDSDNVILLRDSHGDRYKLTIEKL